MSEWAMRRFWKLAEPAAVDGGYTVTLDGRSIKTPAKAALVVPTEALAREIAAEWDAQEEKVNPAAMPFTRMSNSAVDKLSLQRAEVADMLADYGDSDLLCYRADHPDELRDRQTAAWDPLLDWADETYGARLQPRAGIMHAPQDAAALEVLRTEVHLFDNYALAAFHDLVSMSGSLVIGLAVARGRIDGETGWALSRLDEDWQEEQWGEDEEAQEVAARKKAEFLFAEKYLKLSAR